MLNAQESIARLKAAWSEVARSNPESVNIGQFIVSIAHLTMTVKIKIGIWNSGGKESGVEWLRGQPKEDSGGGTAR